MAEGGEQVCSKGKRVYADDLLDIRVEGLKFIGVDGPRDGRCAGRGREDVGSEWQELSAPPGGRTTEGAMPPFVGAEMRLGFHVRAVKSLAAFFRGESPGFQQMYGNALVGEACGEDEAGNAAADDADCRLEDFGSGRLLKIDVQRTSSECDGLQ